MSLRFRLICLIAIVLIASLADKPRPIIMAAFAGTAIKSLAGAPCPACGNVAYAAHGMHANPHKAYLNADGYICNACYQRKRRALSKVANNVTCATCGILFSPVRSDAKFCKNACRQKSHRNGRVCGSQKTRHCRGSFAAVVSGMMTALRRLRA